MGSIISGVEPHRKDNLLLSCSLDGTVRLWKMDSFTLVSIVIPFIGPDIKEILDGKILIIFLPINLNMCFGCSKEPSH